MGVVALLLWLPVAMVVCQTERPHILFILADDLGWGDLGWSEYADIHTPHLSSLREESLELMQFYTQPKCTPTRAALMTSRYPYKMGLQTERVFSRTKNNTLDLKYKLLPAYLKDLGYATHMAGKWHLGNCNKKYTPIGRGFDTHFGPWNGLDDRFKLTSGGVFDWNWQNKPYRQAKGTYTGHLIANHTQIMLENHFKNDTTKDTPVFMYVPFLLPHTPTQAPEEYIQNTTCNDITESVLRRKFCGMVTVLDEAVGNITKTLRELGVIDDFIIMFTSDNGASMQAGARSWPLRGSKQTVYEGGTRARTLLRMRDPFLGQGPMSGEYHGLVHITDIMPTLLEAAGGDLSVLPDDIDGMSVWQSLTNGEEVTRREWMIYNIDSERGLAAIKFKNSTHDFKLIFSNLSDSEPGYKNTGPKPLTEHHAFQLMDRYERNNQEFFFFNLTDNPNETPDRLARHSNQDMFDYVRNELQRVSEDEVPVPTYYPLGGDSGYKDGGAFHVTGC